MDVEIIPLPLFFGSFYMDELMTELARKMADQLEKFLRVCKEEGDITINDVLKRLEELKKET